MEEKPIKAKPIFYAVCYEALKKPKQGIMERIQNVLKGNV